MSSDDPLHAADPADDPEDEQAPDPRGRSIRSLVIGVVLAAIALGVVISLMTRSTDGDDPVDAARAIVADDGEFASGLEAGESFARIAEHLNRAIDECDTVDRCRRLGVASGYAQVLAVTVVPCTAPGRFEARTEFAAFLEEVVSASAGSTPSPPPLPTC